MKRLEKLLRAVGQACWQCFLYRRRQKLNAYALTPVQETVKATEIYFFQSYGVQRFCANSRA